MDFKARHSFFFSAPRVSTCWQKARKGELAMIANNAVKRHGITVAVGYGWQKFDSQEMDDVVIGAENALTQKDVKAGYNVLHDEFWKSIKGKFKPKCDGVEKALKAKISFKRLRASHGKIVWQSILDGIKTADVLIFDIAQAPEKMPVKESDIKTVLSGFNANVLVEIGVALGLDKRVVLMCPEHLFRYVPSDLKGYLWTTYTGSISKNGFKRVLCDERGLQNAFMGMLREAIIEKNQVIEEE